MKIGKLRRILTILVAFMLLLSIPVKAYAADDDNGVNKEVTEDTKGVICILVVYKDDADNLIPVQSGTGFLINDETVITCNHVVVFDEETIAQLMAMYDKKEAEVKAAMQIQIIVNWDVTINATVQNHSTEMDYAILHLEDTLYDRTYLKLRHSSEVTQTETVYALGYPGQVGSFQAVNTYTTEDVTVTDGKVSKVSRLTDNVEYVLHSAVLNAGNSGGPLVDANGAVIGINAMKMGDGFEDAYYYAIAIDQLITTMDSLGVEYTLWENEDANAAEEGTGVDLTALQTEIENAKAIDPSLYTEESYEAVRIALEDAEKLAETPEADQTKIDETVNALTEAAAGLVEAPKFPWLLIGIIAGVVGVAIVIILIVVFKGKGKKKKSAPKYSAAPAYSPLGNPANTISGQSGRQINGFDTASANPAANFYASGGGAGETSVLNAGSGETTVLNEGAGETTLLRPGLSLGTLTRVKNGERITISSDNFVIGKERNRVNYCISDNTSVSRTHVRFNSRGGTTYITDLKTTNGTFLNGVMIQPDQEQPLKNGDRISLADEEFSYTI